MWDAVVGPLPCQVTRTVAGPPLATAHQPPPPLCPLITASPPFAPCAPPHAQVQLAPVPHMLMPKQQVQVVVQVQALSPFQGAPDLLLDYRMGANMVHHQVGGA